MWRTRGGLWECDGGSEALTHSRASLRLRRVRSAAHIQVAAEVPHKNTIKEDLFKLILRFYPVKLFVFLHKMLM